jgi:hypothetical protein
VCESAALSRTGPEAFAPSLTLVALIVELMLDGVGIHRLVAYRHHVSLNRLTMTPMGFEFELNPSRMLRRFIVTESAYWASCGTGNAPRRFGVKPEFFPAAWTF